MEKFDIHYVRAYKAKTDKLVFLALIKEWAKANVPAEVAGEWANLGFTCGEARQHIVAGTTPEDFRLIEERELVEMIAAMDRAENHAPLDLRRMAFPLPPVQR